MLDVSSEIFLKELFAGDKARREKFISIIASLENQAGEIKGEKAQYTPFLAKALMEIDKSIRDNTPMAYLSDLAVKLDREDAYYYLLVFNSVLRSSDAFRGADLTDRDKDQKLLQELLSLYLGEKDKRKRTEEMLEHMEQRTFFLQLTKELKEKVIGNRELICAIAQLIRDCRYGVHNKGMAVDYHNLLLTGESGTGKDFIVSQIRECSVTANWNVYIIDASQITSAGYKGRNLSEIADSLKYDGGYSLVILKEVDKALYKEGCENSPPIQNELLDLLEHTQGALGKVDLSRAVIVLNGTFKRQRTEKAKRTAGFLSDFEAEKTESFVVSDEEAVSYGMSEEMVRRIPYMYRTEKPTREMILEAVDKICEGEMRSWRERGIQVTYSDAFKKQILEEVMKAPVAFSYAGRRIRGCIGGALEEKLYEEKVLEVKVLKDGTLDYEGRKKECSL